ncbi:DUF4258 domain-containing protein [Antarcticibacterium arcticum]|uniref:DUF4258 domain-containing protein n=1 Tax=Antarcticibacterium arcticum TaxID=2585771 RepID=A0A5B8YGF5_9FLAO|nr:DUF4258 domain-containing protein [Antarcticibacterium arcticum]QED36854.1 DUF4258 domain-containing protein [Antarcticibacterium arcticum]
MRLLHRFAYFSVGLIMGIVILMFFLSGKRTSCDYSPNARTLKNIRIKDRVFSDESYRFFQFNNIDTSNVSEILENGKVNFRKSNTNNDPCNIYFVAGDANSKKIELQIENCETTATIQRVSFSE